MKTRQLEKIFSKVPHSSTTVWKTVTNQIEIPKCLFHITGSLTRKEDDGSQQRWKDVHWLSEWNILPGTFMIPKASLVKSWQRAKHKEWVWSVFFNHSYKNVLFQSSSLALAILWAHEYFYEFNLFNWKTQREGEEKIMCLENNPKLIFLSVLKDTFFFFSRSLSSYIEQLKYVTG
jgi:hypothetical protein